MPSLYASPVDPEREAVEILTSAVEQYRPVKVFGLFSGGHDSTSACHVAANAGIPFDGCIHINTQTGIPRTRQFVVDTCVQFGWTFREMFPPQPPTWGGDEKLWGEAGQTAYEAIVMRWGFPGKGAHTPIYNRLKERCIRRLVNEHTPCEECGILYHDHGNKDEAGHVYHSRPIMLVTGVRKAESKRRMGHIVPHQMEGARRLWCAPLVNWTSDDKEAYMRKHDLPRNPVVATLCMSGECLCGAFAKPGELVEIEATYPEVAERIRALERIAKTAGVPCEWGKDPPEKPDESEWETPLFNGIAGLCWSCEAKAEPGETKYTQHTGDL